MVKLLINATIAKEYNLKTVSVDLCITGKEFATPPPPTPNVTLGIVPNETIALSTMTLTTPSNMSAPVSSAAPGFVGSGLFFALIAVVVIVLILGIVVAVVLISRKKPELEPAEEAATEVVVDGQSEGGGGQGGMAAGEKPQEFMAVKTTMGAAAPAQADDGGEGPSGLTNIDFSDRDEPKEDDKEGEENDDGDDDEEGEGDAKPKKKKKYADGPEEVDEQRIQDVPAMKAKGEEDEEDGDDENNDKGGGGNGAARPDGSRGVEVPNESMQSNAGKGAGGGEGGGGAATPDEPPLYEGM